jgi:molybdopterin converting factor small subunit
MANGNIRITVSFGGNQLPINGLPVGSTLSCIRANRNVSAALGYSNENVEFVLNGSRASDNTVISDGDVVNVQHKAHEKASA